MVAKRPKIVIVGAGMAGLAAAHKLYRTPGSKELFELCVVEGGQRIGGRINTTEFGGDRTEMGATWIHGIGGSPIYEIAKKVKSLVSEKPWECMDGFFEEKLSMAKTRAEGGFVVNPTMVEPISSLFDRLMSFAQGKVEEGSQNGDVGGSQLTSIGSFLKHGLDEYWDCQKRPDEELKLFGHWTKKMLEEAIFATHENTHRTYTGADDLFNLDFTAENEYRMFPGEEITIPRGYISIIEALASVLPPGLIQLGRKVVKIEWQPNGHQWVGSEHDQTSRPVKLHFSEGSIMEADHVIVTVSLGVLKAGIREGSSLFIPSLPSLKKDAISRLGYGVVNKLFLQLSPSNNQGLGEDNFCKFPFMQLVFHRPDSKFRDRKIPWWLRRTASLYPIYSNSSVLLSWFAGEEALELESLDDDTIIDGVSTTVSSFIAYLNHQNQGSSHSHQVCNGRKSGFEFRKVLKTKWGTDPLFLGSYSFVAVGSSGKDFDSLAQPLPRVDDCGSTATFHPLQILFAGEATHRTHYSTTHGAYFSGLREANRLLENYQFSVVAKQKT